MKENSSMRFMQRSLVIRGGLFASALLATMVLVSGTAAAQSRVAVLPFSGPTGGAARDKVVAALAAQSGVTVVPGSELEKAAEKAGVSTTNYTAVAAQANINAFVEGKVTKKGRKFNLALTVRDGANGEEVGSTSFVGPNARVLGKNVRTQTWKRIGDAIKGAQAPDMGGGGAAEEEAAPVAVEEEAEPAAANGARVVVRSFEGAGADSTRAAVVSSLESKGYEVVDASVADDTASSEGADLGTPEGRVTVARKINVSAFVEGRVSRAGRRRFRAQVAVYNGEDGERLGQSAFTARTAGAVSGSVKQRFWPELGDAVSRGTAPGAGGGRPSVKEPVDGDEPVAAAEEEEEETDSGARPSPLTISGKYVLFWRSFGYKDDLNDSLLKYNLGPASSVRVDAEWYPLAHFMGGIPANIGLEGRFGLAFGLKSQFARNGETFEYSTGALDWLVGARFRIPFDRDELSVGVGYGAQNFTIDAKPGAAVVRPDIPDVNYSFLRFSVGGRYWMGPISLRGHGGFLLVLNAGDTGEGIASSDRGTAGTTGGWFPNLSANGLEGGVEVGYEVMTGLEARLGFDLRYYFFSLNPKVGDPAIAGGATDLYPAVTVGVSYTLPGSGSDEGDGAEEGGSEEESGPSTPDESGDL